MLHSDPLTRKHSIIVFIVLVSVHISLCAEQKRYDSIIHVHSVFSSGTYSLEQITQKAQKHGISIIIPTDSFLHKWEYGWIPWIKKTVELPSVSKTGIKNYLDIIQSCQEKYPNILIIPGVEAAPWYYWKGNPLWNNLTLYDAHKHVLVIGLDSELQYKKLPVKGNSSTWLWQWYASGERSYQHIINYTVAHNGIIFFAHPDVNDYRSLQALPKINNVRDPYGLMIINTHNFTGFSIFRQGTKTGAIGGYWDIALMRYCEESRDMPVWTIGEADYTGPAGGDRIDQTKTVFYVQKFSKKAILHALRTGSCYSIIRPETHELICNEWYITDGMTTAHSGETLHTRTNARLFLSLSASDLKKHSSIISVISNGQEIYASACSIPGTFSLPLTEWIGKLKTYFRISIIEDETSRIMTNPIFIDAR